MTVPERLPASVVGFMKTYIDSLEMLMLLLLVHRAPSGTISVPIAARLVDIPIAETRAIARALADRALVRLSSQPELIELTLPSIDDRLALADLASCYEENRAVVLDALVAIVRTTR